MKKEFKEFINNFKNTAKYFKLQKKIIFFYLFISLIIGIIGIIIPILTSKLLINITEGNLNSLLTIAFVIFVTKITSKTLQSIYSLTSKKLEIKISMDLKKEIIDKTLSIKINEFETETSGTFIHRIKNDADDIVRIFNVILTDTVEMVSNIGIIVTIFILNKYLCIYLIAFNILIAYRDSIELVKMRKYIDIKFEKSDETTGFIGELIRGIKDVKSLNIENNFKNVLTNKIDDLNQHIYESLKLSEKNSWFLISSRELCTLIFFILGVLLIKQGKLNTATFMIIYTYKSDLSYIFASVSSYLKRVQSFNLYSERVNKILSEVGFSKENFGNVETENQKGTIEFKNVKFKYDKSQKNVLKNINFKINENEIVSFVGKSGSGKTTIFNLIDKLYDVEDNKIFIGDKDINSLSNKALRSEIAIVTQSPYIFNLTISENLKLVDPKLSKKEMIKYCKMACIHDYIMTLPKKYDTVLGEGGLKLSGGQKQRLAIARALIKNSKILLLDEATSALDNETQANIQEVIKNMKGKCTIAIIAHRLSTVKSSDKIFVVDGGKIISEGTHEKLINECNVYKKLYNHELI